MHYQPAPEGKYPHLWQLAQKRASFRKHLASYVVMNLFFWILWYFAKGMHEHATGSIDFFPDLCGSS